MLVRKNVAALSPSALVQSADGARWPRENSPPLIQSLVEQAESRERGVGRKTVAPRRRAQMARIEMPRGPVRHAAARIERERVLSSGDEHVIGGIGVGGQSERGVEAHARRRCHGGDGARDGGACRRTIARGDADTRAAWADGRNHSVGIHGHDRGIAGCPRHAAIALGDPGAVGAGHEQLRLEAHGKRRRPCADGERGHAASGRCGLRGEWQRVGTTSTGGANQHAQQRQAAANECGSRAVRMGPVFVRRPGRSTVTHRENPRHVGNVAGRLPESRWR